MGSRRDNTTFLSLVFLLFWGDVLSISIDLSVHAIHEWFGKIVSVLAVLLGKSVSPQPPTPSSSLVHWIDVVTRIIIVDLYIFQSELVD